jgi:hypothetical protein
MRQEGSENVSSLYIQRGTTGGVRHHVLNVESVYLRRQYRTVVQLVWISPRQSYLAAIHVLQPHASSHSQCLPVPRRTTISPNLARKSNDRDRAGADGYRGHRIHHKDSHKAVPGDLLFRGIVTPSRAWKRRWPSETLCERQRSSFIAWSAAAPPTPQYGRRIRLPYDIQQSPPWRDSQLDVHRGASSPINSSYAGVIAYAGMLFFQC